MNNLRTVITRCENVIEQNSQSSNAINWLNDLCKEFKALFHGLHTYLASARQIGSSMRNSCLLCTSQIVVCIRFLERTNKAERSGSVGLEATRKIFLDRILWCLAKLAESTEEPQITDDDEQRKVFNMDTSNFVVAMDNALDMVAPLTMFGDDKDNTGNSLMDLGAMSISRIQAVVHTLIGHALTFANLAQPEDRIPLTTVCQSVLREYVKFEGIASISHHQEDDRSQSQIHATRLENALYQLDGLVNDSLLRLVYGVFVQMKANPLSALAEMVECGQNQEADEQIARFDEMADRLQQIGIFAAAFAPNQQAQTVIRSALASFESLEPVLIPVLLLPHSPHHSAILAQHWTEESTNLLTTVQRIIDSHAFCVCLCEHLSAAIAQLQKHYERSQALTSVAHCSIFQDHLRHNWSDLESNGSVVEKAEHFQLMLTECRAAVDACSEAVEWPRVIKRFRIMFGVLRKLCASLKECATDDTRNEEFTVGNVTEPISRMVQRSRPSIALPVDSLIALNGETDTVDDSVFESFGIAPATRNSILYSNAPLGDRRPSRRSNTSERNINDMTSSCAPRIARNPSLRSRLFKRAIPVFPPSTAVSSINDDQSFDLQITDILEQLTDLSTTLSNGFLKQ